MSMKAAYQYALAKRLCKAETQGKGAWRALKPEQRKMIEQSVNEAAKQFFATTNLDDAAINALDVWEDGDDLIAESQGRQWRIVVRSRDEQEILLRWESDEPLEFASIGWEWYGIACSAEFRGEVAALSSLMNIQKGKETKQKLLESLLMEIHYAYLYSSEVQPEEESMVERLWQTLCRSVLARVTDEQKVITIFPEAATLKPTCLWTLRIIEGEEPEAEIKMDNGWTFRLRAEIQPIWDTPIKLDFRILVRFCNEDGKLPFVPAIDFLEQ